MNSVRKSQLRKQVVEKCAQKSQLVGQVALTSNKIKQGVDFNFSLKVLRTMYVQKSRLAEQVVLMI